MGKFVKAKSEQAFFKVGLYGKAGSGKTLTALLVAEGLAARSGGRVAVIDTENGTDFYTRDIPERTVHPMGFDFDVLKSRSIMETLEAIESIDPKEHSVVVIDSLTHLWEATRDAYQGKKLPNGGIPVHAWGPIKKPYKKLMSFFLDGHFHGILCGREGVVMEEDESGEMHVTGVRMKSEGETPYEPHILVRMIPERAGDGAHIITAFVEKDRSGILAGKTVRWPKYETFAPIVGHLSGTTQGRLGTPEENAERDAAAQQRLAEAEEAERVALFQHIRDAIQASKTLEGLRVAWELTKGKKGRLGEELLERLSTAKDARKVEITGVV